MSGLQTRLLRRACGVLAAVALAGAPAVAGASGEGRGTSAPRPALRLEVSPWTFRSQPLRLSLEQGGVLEGRRLALFLFVDGNQFERLKTTSDRTEARIELPELAPGNHRFVVRAGTEFAEAEFRVLPWTLRAAGLAALGLVALFAAALAVRARRRAGGTRALQPPV